MPTIIENINSIIGTKNDLGDIIRENNIVVPDTFDQYPAAIRSAIAAGSVVDQDTINSYISTYLNTYNYIDQNELSSNSYATQTYVVNYVNEHGGSGVIDENIIPKENNTYTLGNASYLYKATYTYYVGAYNSGINVDNAQGLVFSINNNNRLYLGNSQFRPLANNYLNFGTSSAKWKCVYTYDVYVDSQSISDIYTTYSYVYSIVGDIESLLANI